MSNYDIVVIGGGAAGLTAAIFSAQPSLKVLLLEKAPMCGRKILMSGGTRCNILPYSIDLKDYHSKASPHLLHKILKSWRVEDCLAWFQQELGLKTYLEQSTLKWFPESNSAREVRDVLLQKVKQLGVEIRYDAHVYRMDPISPKVWQIYCRQQNEPIRSKCVILATGGLSIPSTGTTGDGHALLRDLGEELVPTYPALTSLLGDHPGVENLAGLSLEVGISVYVSDRLLGSSNRSGFLFTHRGFSGPSVLDSSHLMENNPNASLLVNWGLKTTSFWEDYLLNASGQVNSTLVKHLPERLVKALLMESGLPLNKKISDLTKQDRLKLIYNLTAYKLKITGSEGYKKAEVTGGGYPLSAIHHATLESKTCANLYLTGELLDVFGRIGGFNFYWAWLTGRLAGLSASKSLIKSSS
jgi:hypothetical protein